MSEASDDALAVELKRDMSAALEQVCALCQRALDADCEIKFSTGMDANGRFVIQQLYVLKRL